MWDELSLKIISRYCPFKTHEMLSLYSETNHAWLLGWAGPLKSHDYEVLPKDPKNNNVAEHSISITCTNEQYIKFREDVFRTAYDIFSFVERK
jgi:hypothetical protein